MSVSVYRLRDATGRLLYVGCSTNPAGRLSHHRRKPWGAAIAGMEVEHFPDRMTAARAEHAAINTEAPAHNRMTRLDGRT